MFFLIPKKVSIIFKHLSNLTICNVFCEIESERGLFHIFYQASIFIVKKRKPLSKFFKKRKI